MSGKEDRRERRQRKAAARRERERPADYVTDLTPQDLYQMGVDVHHGNAQKLTRFQDARPVSKVNRLQGPMAFLGDQIVKRMGKSGYPSKVQELWRSPERQDQVYKRGHSKARAWQSAHQFYEAVDIVHKTLYWEAPPEYWDHLAVTVRVVEKEYGLELDHGHNWKFVDSAHIEMPDWRSVRDQQHIDYRKNFEPSGRCLYERFLQVLPSQAPKITKEQAPETQARIRAAITDTRNRPTVTR